MCHIDPTSDSRVIVISLTHLRVHPGLPIARAVLEYQKHRVKKLKIQVRMTGESPDPA